MHPDRQTSLAVASPEIDEVLVNETGELVAAWLAIGEDYEKALQLRMALRQGIAADKPILRCPFCTVPVHLVSLATERKFYFRHETEDGRCPAKTKGSLSPERILAMKYDGARESAAHRRMKEIVAESLRGDPDFSDVEIEKVWKGAEENSRRKPDVRAVWRGILPVAFEVQLSTTFLRVTAERREFYLREGGLLFWVFKDFDLSNARLTQEDVFFNNNRNAFIANVTVQPPHLPQWSKSSHSLGFDRRGSRRWGFAKRLRRSGRSGVAMLQDGGRAGRRSEGTASGTG